MVSSKESAKGHAKNARNKLKAMLWAKRKGKELSEEDIEYAFDEIKASLDEL